MKKLRMAFARFFFERKEKPKTVSAPPPVAPKQNNDMAIARGFDELEVEIKNLHGVPDSIRLTPEEKIRKVREAERREIERQKRLSPIQERMKRGQLEERIFPKRIDPSQVKKHNREIARNITMSEACNLYAIVIHARGIRSLEDLERKDLDPKHRRYLLHHVLDANTMEKLISAVWREEPDIRNLSGITQRQAIHAAITNLFI
jgi:hypothetical protein